MIFRHALIIIGCVLIFGSAPAQAQTDAPQTDDSSSPTKIVSPAAPRLRTPDERRYRLNPGDVLEIVYRYTPELDQTVTVQPDGFVTLEVVGEIKVGGLNLPQIKKEIVEKAQVRLKDPEVTLLLKEFQKPYFVVSGEVVQPGRFEMRENLTALQAVMFAGGFKESAKSSQIVVYRKINSEFAEVKLLNLKKIKKEDVLEEDLMLQSGDMLLVPRNTISKIERIVRLVSLAPVFRFLP